LTAELAASGAGQRVEEQKRVGEIVNNRKEWWWWCQLADRQTNTNRRQMSKDDSVDASAAGGQIVCLFCDCRRVVRAPLSPPC
jgi:hypothetical protein